MIYHGFETITLISNRRFLTISRPSYRPLRPPRLRHHVRVADAVENKLSFCVDIARAVARMFTCPGDVAQLGERLGRIEGGRGFIPFVSTTGFGLGSGNGAFSCRGPACGCSGRPIHFGAQVRPFRLPPRWRLCLRSAFSASMPDSGGREPLVLKDVRYDRLCSIRHLSSIASCAPPVPRQPCRAVSAACGPEARLKIARAALHFWRAPISGEAGSGTILFSACPLKCVYCQNHEISTGIRHRSRTGASCRDHARAPAQVRITSTW